MINVAIAGLWTDQNSSSEYVLSEMTEQFHSIVTPANYRRCLNDIRNHLAEFELYFEGKDVPVSTLPTLILREEIEEVRRCGDLIQKVLLKIAQAFILEHQKGDFNGPFHQMYSPYRRWWTIIGTEKRQLHHIGLMRYDSAREPSGRWRFFESNTACPGGVVSMSLINNVWKQTEIGKSVTNNLNIKNLQMSSPRAFIKYLVNQASRISQNNTPNIAICSHKGVYTYELTTLRKVHAEMIESGDLAGGKLVLSDIGEIECDGGEARIHGLPISLIYNKLDPLMIDPSDDSLKGWLMAAQSEKVDFLNSLAAMYLTETKRTFAILSDPVWWQRLGLDQVSINAINAVIPYTRVLPDENSCNLGEQHLLSFVRNNRHQLILKPDALTRGAGVFVGSQQTRAEWAESLVATRCENGIVQDSVMIPFRDNYDLEDNTSLSASTEYYGVELYYFADRFSGLGSRCHSKKVINVGSGGRISPVFIVS